MALFAKSPKSGVTVKSHTNDVLTASKCLFGDQEPTELTKSWYRFFKRELDDKEWQRFRLHLTLACLFHDIGKATNTFQEMLLEQVVQPIRHEYLSAAILARFRTQLLRSGVCFHSLVSAILGHHLKLSFEYLGSLDPNANDIKIYRDGELEWILEAANQALAEVGFSSHHVPETLEASRVLERGFWDSVLVDLATHFLNEGSHAVPRVDEFRKLLLYALIISDSAGSGLRRVGGEAEDPQSTLRMEEWLRVAFKIAPLTPQDIENDIIAKATGGEERPVQTFVDSLTGDDRRLHRMLLLASCGSGKTLAAWKWIKKVIEYSKAPIRRAIFLYPTRNTATEGFRDYISGALEQGTLHHGTADYDLEGMFDTGDPRAKASYRDLERLFALQLWKKRYISATIDSFLSFSAHSYAGICSLPVLAESVVVVDEVHALDPRMLIQLRDVLNTFEFPVLLMTATLPKAYEGVFEKLHLRPDTPPSDPQDDSAKKPRHRLVLRPKESPGLDEMVTRAKEWLDVEDRTNKRRLLIVCNTVERCQEVARRLQESVSDENPKVLVYHSRFKLVDRKKRHEQVMGDFKHDSKFERVVVVSTQVCQMSLNLDADTLITELAPMADLIQRIGRVNRYLRYFDALVEIVEPPKAKPYLHEELRDTRQLLDAFLENRTGMISQEELGTLMHETFSREIPEGLVTPILSKTGEIATFSYREPDDFTVDAVMDAEEYLAAEQSKRVELVLPVPRYTAEGDDRLGRYLMVVSKTKGTYTEKLGFESSRRANG